MVTYANPAIGDTGGDRLPSGSDLLSDPFRARRLGLADARGQRRAQRLHEVHARRRLDVQGEHGWRRSVEWDEKNLAIDRREPSSSFKKGQTSLSRPRRPV